MVFNWYIKQLVKKKYSVKSKDKNDWVTFTKEISHIYDKDIDNEKQNIKIGTIKKLDLHGFSLEDANKIVKKFIIESHENNLKQLLIITGKGSRSETHKNPYLSEKMSVLRYSVPEFIKNDEELIKIVRKLSTDNLKDDGKGSFYIFLN